MASFHFRIKSGKKGNAAEHAAYIARQGKHRIREDLVLLESHNMPKWAEQDNGIFWRAADRNERKNGAVYRELEIALPGELSHPQQVELSRELANALVGAKPYVIAMHCPSSSLAGVQNAHIHVMYSDRVPDQVERSPDNMFRRYNANEPEKGGCRKASGGKTSIELRDELIAMRRVCADLQNAALAKHGHAVRVDPRSLKQQGLDRQPERHLGPSKIKRMSKAAKDEFVVRRALKPLAQATQTSGC